MVYGLAVFDGHVSQELLQPLLPGVGAVSAQDGARVQQRHGGVAVQVLQAAAQHQAPLLQQGAHLRLQLLTLADQVGLARVLQEDRRRDVAGGAWRGGGGSGRIKRRVKEETNGSGKVEERVRNKETDTDFETDSLLKLTALCGGGE